MSCTTRGEERRSAKAFRAFLALYPAAFRDEYGRELSLVFVDRYRDATGPWDRATLWLDVLTGVAVEAPKEHGRAREDGLQIEGYEASPDERVVFLVNSVSPNYFSITGTRLIAGRTFTHRDVEN